MSGSMSDNEDMKLYNNNPNIKGVGQAIQFTGDQINEYLKCSEDVSYFINNYCQIVTLDFGLQPFKLYPYQERLIKTVNENRKVIALLGRQFGKTQTSAAYILWYTLFHSNKNVAIMAHKAPAAREVLYRYQLMYEHLPKWLQQGIRVWNKGNIELENGSVVFTSATSASGIRGKSCVTEDTKVCVLNDDSIYYTEISQLINSRFINIKESTMFYTVYKITNLINNKIYVGYHQTTNINDGYMGSGTLIKRAIEKYGIESFEKEILEVFDNKEDAEKYEASIVDRDFTMREDTYNLNLGGNVRISYGPNNGFYGKQHTEKTKKEISKIHIGNKYNSNAKDHRVRHIESGIVYLDSIELRKEYPHLSKSMLVNAIGNEEFEYLDSKKQEAAIESFNNKLNSDEKKILLSELCKNRFTGSTQSSEHVEKRTEGHLKWIEENPELHIARMLQINKNPEKIRKTAEKHRGMKRSDETRQNISNALKGKPSKAKGHVLAHDPITGQQKFFSSIENIPSNFVKGKKAK